MNGRDSTGWYAELDSTFEAYVKVGGMFVLGFMVWGICISGIK
jgi:hypothetical protein